jgi:hypothetical protein
MNVVNNLLTIYTWGTVCVLLFFLYAIARFYEKKSGRHSYFWAFLIPIILFALAAVRYVYLAPAIAGDSWGDLMRFVGGITLGGVGFFLLKLMVGGRTQ